MKKTIVVVLMVVTIVTPCFAQEVETDSIFSIGGTKWQALPIGVVIFPFPWIHGSGVHKFGFSGGKVYVNSEAIDGYLLVDDSFYKDLLVCSVFSADILSVRTSSNFSIEPNQTAGGAFAYSYSGILQPIGIGMMVQYIWVSSLPALSIFLLFKTDDDWTPPEVG